jgi:hypothetical protein
VDKRLETMLVRAEVEGWPDQENEGYMGFSVRADCKPVCRLTSPRLTAVDVAATTTSPFVDVAQNRTLTIGLCSTTTRRLMRKSDWKQHLVNFPSLKFQLVGCCENHRSFMDFRNSGSIGYPEAEPITESIPQLGHMGVCSSSNHSLISAGENVARQLKHPQISLTITSRRVL